MTGNTEKNSVTYLASLVLNSTLEGDMHLTQT